MVPSTVTTTSSDTTAAAASAASAAAAGQDTAALIDDRRLADEIEDLEQRLASITVAHERYHLTLASAASRLDSVVADHVSSTLPPLRDLVTAARYFWAGMIDAGDAAGEIDEPDEEDVERALRDIEKSVSALDSACEAGLRLLDDEDMETDHKNMRLNVTGAYNAAFGFWKDCDSRRIPEARQLLEANMQAIAGLEKEAAAQAPRADESAGSPHSPLTEDDALAYRPLGTNKSATRSAELVEKSRAQSQLRSSLREALAAHQVLAQSVTKLVCQGTHLKQLRNELRGQDLLGTLCEQRLKATSRRLQKGRLGAAAILDAIRDMLAQLEWADTDNESSFPAEALLCLAARLVVHAKRYSHRGADVELVGELAVLLRDPGKSAAALPPSVAEVLLQLDAPRNSHAGTGTQKSLPARPGVVGQHRCVPLETTQNRTPAGLAALPPMPIQEAPASPSPAPLQILGASWAGKDVTKILASRVKDNKLVVNMHNIHTVLGDPMPYKYKILTGLYRYGDRGEERLFIISEQLPLFSSSVFVISPPRDGNPSNRLSIPTANCAWQDANGRFEIVAVTYGPRHVRNEAVLADFADYFSGRKPCIVPDNSFFRGDPWPGQDKTWTVFVRFLSDRGAVTTVTGLEGKGLDSAWKSLSG